ncbi:hypothetical protein H9L13_05030 [Sphingomonas lutea]|uniref:DUF6894 domain-containing protein n=1 Tax=Sphingomonas lutea TaxID=1045317 RepID=A0A7G9SK66_9SPHN|nr:hypothetical protein [Sphingomonas lutea]QNN68241.1 hypothetical protein H9L13_05030 [Sphingomonas lutea]
MPRFFFHLHNAVNVHDDVGRELPSLEAAQAEATLACRALMAEDVRTEGQITLSHRIDIHGEDGQLKLALPFRACVEIRP